MNWVSIGSDNGLLPIRRQAIILTNTGLLSIGLLETNFSEILIKIQNFSFTKMHLKRLSEKWQPFCPGGDELKTIFPSTCIGIPIIKVRWSHLEDCIAKKDPHLKIHVR